MSDYNNNNTGRRRPENYVPQNARYIPEEAEKKPVEYKRTFSTPNRPVVTDVADEDERKPKFKRVERKAPDLKFSGRQKAEEPEDIFDDEEDEEEKKNSFFEFFWTDKQQRARNIFAVLTVFFVMITLLVGFVSSKLDLIDTKKPANNKNNIENYSQVDIIYEDEAVTPAKTVNDAVSYTDFSYKWATNGSPLRSSKNVINILLIGLDSDDALENGGRSDSMILASLNKKEKKIYLTSFYRDTWTYMNTGGTETYTKMNAAYAYGKDDGIVATIENNFKIHIDYYVTVDFSSFTDIINTLGGITVKIEQYEAEYINRTSVHNIEWGDAVKLDGWEALVFARIRKSDGDSDVSRTRRQRIVISSFIDSVKDANISQINNILNKLFGYVRTDLSKMEILSYGVQGLANNWADYDIESVLLNDESIYRTGYVGNSSCVFVDFPKVSELVQNTVYGDSSVVAADNQSPFDFMSRNSKGDYVLR